MAAADEKACRKCEAVKPLSEYHFRKDTGRHRSECKACVNARAAVWAAKNPDKVKAAKKKYLNENRDKAAAASKRWKSSNRDKINAAQRKWREANPDRCKAYGRAGYARHAVAARARSREWYAKNKDKALAIASEYAKRPHVRQRINLRKAERLKSDPAFAMNHRMRVRLRECLSVADGKAGRSWESLVGYTANDLRRHLEAQFHDGMSWENMADWEIDHIVPLADFDIKEAGDAEFMAAWSLGNLRPAWRKINRSKSAKRLFLL